MELGFYAVIPCHRVSPGQLAGQATLARVLKVKLIANLFTLKIPDHRMDESDPRRFVKACLSTKTAAQQGPSESSRPITRPVQPARSRCLAASA